MKAKLGMSPIAWWNDDDPSLSETYSSRSACASRARPALPAWRRAAGSPMIPTMMLPILRAADVTLCGGWFSGTLVNEDMAANQDRILPMIELFKAVDAPCIVYGEVGRSIQGDRTSRWRRSRSCPTTRCKAYARKVTEFGEWCAGQGMPLSYHHHMARWSRPSRSSMPSCGIRAPAFRCCSMPATWRSRAATCSAPSTTTTRASPTCT